MASGDLTQRVAVNGQDELATLGQAFNHMAASLQQAQQSTARHDGRYCARAAHADCHPARAPRSAARWYLSADGENLQPVLESTELLTRLVEDLAHPGAGRCRRTGLERGPGDLALLVGRVVERFRPEAESRQINLVISRRLGQRPGKCLLDAGRIEQIFNNLLSNGLRYTPRGAL
jgi:two-component system, OmpR family, sensor histidine kinase BaeS